MAEAVSINKGIIHLNETPEEPMNVIYRGWMFMPEQYKDFYQKLQVSKINLVIAPSQYSYFMDFSKTYPDFSKTTKALFFDKGEKVELKKIKKRMSRFMIKDYIKSVHDSDFPEFFICESLTQEQLDSWILRFNHLRGSHYTGGICIKEYVDLKKYDGKTNECRVFYIADQAIICQKSGQNLRMSKIPKKLVEKYIWNLTVFYSADYAELEDGSWKILNIRDGQVSEIFEDFDLFNFYKELKHGLGYYD